MTEITKHDNQSFKGFFTQALDTYLESSQNHYPNTGVIRPSMIHLCSRLIAADILNILPVEPNSAVQQRVLDNGIYVHKRILQKYLPKMGIVSHILDIKKGEVKPFIEVSLRDDSLWLKGNPDAVIINTDNGLPYVFELKSIRSGEFQSLMFPKPEHVIQLHCYFNLTNIPRGILFYECKDSQRTKEFQVERDELLMTNILNKISKIQVAVKNKNLGIPCDNTTSKACKCAGLMI